MKAETKPNDPAFAKNHVQSNGELIHQPGLTKREYFAAMAMQAMLVDSQYKGHTVDFFTKNAVLAADALIESLNSPDKQ